MFKSLTRLVCLLFCLASFAVASVSVSAPINNGTYSGPVQFTATGSTSCSRGVGSMGIYTAPGVLAYVTNGNKINTTLNLTPASYNIVITAWDNCGGSSTAGVKITVQSGGSGVSVSSPANNSTVSSPVHYKATATTTCSKGVSSMGIYTAPYQLAYTTQGASLDTNLSLSPGTYNTTVIEWDGCGGAATTGVKITVTGGTGKTFSQIQHAGGWGEAGQRGPNFINCSPSPCENITFSMTQNIKNPSMSGEATQYSLGGSQGYGDGFWNNHLIGPFSSQGMPDSNHTLVPTLHDFTYDVYFWGSNLGLSQAVEFDINQFFNDMGFIYGHECRIDSGNEWDVWDNANAKWVPTGVPCYPNQNAWNHITLKVQRTSDNHLTYQSITLNGNTTTLNWSFEHGSAPGWYGVTVNFQMDGDGKQDSYNVSLDNLTVTYQ